MLVASAAAAGVLSHVLYFNKGEHHMWGIRYLITFATVFLGSIIALVQLSGWPVLAAISTTAIISSTYLAGLLTSLLVYRIWLSPLNKFPGPFGAKISGLWMTVHGRNSDLYLKNTELHKKYGKYVRIGPNILSITDADIHEPAFDIKKPWPKAEW